MSDAVIEGKILRWGNSYGVRIRKADLEASQLEPGEEVTIRIERSGDRIDLSGLRVFEGGAPDVSERHDTYLGQARSETHVSPGEDRPPSGPVVPDEPSQTGARPGEDEEDKTS